MIYDSLILILAFLGAYAILIGFWILCMVSIWTIIWLIQTASDILMNRKGD